MGRRQGRTPRFHPAARPAAVLLGVVLAAGAASALTACDQQPERSTEAYCAQVTKVTGLDQALASGDADRSATMLAELRTLQAVAPSEIEPQVGTLVTVLADLQTTAATVANPQDAVREVFTRRQAEVPAITQAGADVEAYTQRTCNVTLNATAGSTPGSVPGSVPGTTPTTTK